MNFLTAALALLGTQPRDLPLQDPIRNGTLHRKEVNPRTGREEVVAIVQWDEAVPRADREILDLRGVRAKYFTEPRPGGTPSETVELTANRARYDGPAGKLDLTEQVRIVHQDGTVLQAPSARILFHRRYPCSSCGAESPKPGPCPRCGDSTRPRTFTTLEAENEFSLERPGMRLTGRQLQADDRFGRIAVGREGSLEMAGRQDIPGSEERPRPDPAGDSLTELRCDGPLSIQELSPDRTRFSLEARQNVRLLRRDAGGRISTVTADQVELTARRRRDLRTGRFSPRPDPERVSARGHLSLQEAQGLQAEAETLDWEAREVLPAQAIPGGVAGALLQTLGATRHERAHLTGNPVVLSQDSNQVRSRIVDIDRQAGRIVFSGDVTASLPPPDRAGGRPLELSGRILEALQDPAAKNGRLQYLEAREEVRIIYPMDGPPEQAAPIRAEGDRFVWDPENQRGFLEGRPFARLRQGPSDIQTPRVILERTVVVLQGPKRLRLVREGGGDPAAPLSLSSEGDVTLDVEGGRAHFPDRTLARSEDFRLEADRMDLIFAPGGKGVESLRASGNLRAWRSREGITLYGDRLRYDPRTRTLSILGYPRAVADAGGRYVQTREIRFREESRTTELLGGEEGILMVIEETEGRPPPGGPDPSRLRSGP